MRKLQRLSRAMLAASRLRGGFLVSAESVRGSGWQVVGLEADHILTQPFIYLEQSGLLGLQFVERPYLGGIAH